MIQAVNMAGSSIYTLLALIAIVAQSGPLTNARAGSRSHPRRLNGNTNINTNINTFHKSRRLYEVLAREEAEMANDKTQEGKDIQTAIIATAAADAAKTATRIIAKKLTENTADAVAHAVVRVLAGKDMIDKRNDTTEEMVNESARRSSRFFNKASSKIMHRSRKTPPPPSSSSSSSSSPPPPPTPPATSTASSEGASHNFVEKRQKGDVSSGDVKEKDEPQSAAGDVPLDEYSSGDYEYDDEKVDDGDDTKKDVKEEPQTRQNKNTTKTLLRRRFLDHPDAWKNHFRRSAVIKRGNTRDN